jgi:hypothetical protein
LMDLAATFIILGDNFDNFDNQQFRARKIRVIQKPIANNKVLYPDDFLVLNIRVKVPGPTAIKYWVQRQNYIPLSKL